MITTLIFHQNHIGRIQMNDVLGVSDHNCACPRTGGTATALPSADQQILYGGWINRSSAAPAPARSLEKIENSFAGGGVEKRALPLCQQHSVHDGAQVQPVQEVSGEVPVEVEEEEDQAPPAQAPPDAPALQVRAWAWGREAEKRERRFEHSGVEARGDGVLAGLRGSWPTLRPCLRHGTA
eukprot:COSAG02_NODE_1207_length_13885_cov_124.791237_13_plen_181_part_00